MDDMSFLTGPALADVDGDGKADVVMGSGGYMVRAFRSDGSQPTGWPKFTYGWVLASPVAGDVDGDGKIEVVAATREGYLYVWDTAGRGNGSEPALAGHGTGSAQHAELELRRSFTCASPGSFGRLRLADRSLSNTRLRRGADQVAATGVTRSARSNRSLTQGVLMAQRPHARDAKGARETLGKVFFSVSLAPFASLA